MLAFSSFLRKTWLILIVAIPSLVMTSCHIAGTPTPTPPPGWYSDLRELFVDEAAFPSGWRAHMYQETNVHPRANHVRRRFSSPFLPGVVTQDVWRAYTIGDAERKFAEEAEGWCFVHGGWYTRFPTTSFCFPPEITYRSKVADEWCLTCGMDVTLECHFAARYRNYVVRLRVPMSEKGYMYGLTFNELDGLLEGIDAQFVQHLGFLVTTPREPVATPQLLADLQEGRPQPGIDSLLVDAASLPTGWEIAFVEWEKVKSFDDGFHIVTRNFRKENCYSDVSDLQWCYITQFVSWYPRVQDAEDDREREWSAVDVGDSSSSLGVLRIPPDITYRSSIADEQFVACVTLAGGEECEAVMRYGNYLVILRADMMSIGTMMGYSRYGLTHAEFTTLVEAIDAKIELELDPYRE